MVDLGGCIGDRVLLVERDPVGNGQAPTAMLDRPAQTGQARFREMLVPGAPLFESLVFAAGPAETLERGEFTGQILGQPIADPCPKLLDALHPCRLTYQALALLAPASGKKPWARALRSSMSSHPQTMPASSARSAREPPAPNAR